MFRMSWCADRASSKISGNRIAIAVRGFHPAGVGAEKA
jgi:hypothetical protein